VPLGNLKSIRARQMAPTIAPLPAMSSSAQAPTTVVEAKRSPPSYDKDQDSVRPNDFDQMFEEAPLILFVPNDRPGWNTDNRLAPHLPEISDLEHLVRNLIASAWEGQEEHQVDAEVGDVSGTAISRVVSRFERRSD
jgi:hypothetical protein